MKTRKLLIMKNDTALLLLIFLIITNSSFAQQGDRKDKFPAPEDLYFGLKPPGMIAEPFVPGIMSQKGWELGGIHDSDMKEFYLTSSIDAPYRPLVVSFRKENRAWKKYDFYYTGGNTLYSKDKYIQRTDSGWSEIKSLGAPFDDIAIMRLTASLKGTLVFDERTRDGNGVLRYSRLVNGKRETPKPFGKVINTGKWTAHPFIAADESYIIWDSEREGGYGDSDMYISFRQQDGSWGAAINFGDKINTDGEDGGGYVTPDGKYLFYCPRCKPPFDRKWVDAKIIETLRPNNISFEQNLPKFVQVEGGTFTMGDEWGQGNKDQRPTHEVTLKNFNISQTEVTVAQYRYYCNATGVAMPEEPSWGWENNHPIVNVSWQDAINYTNWLSGKLGQMVRLPYEAEWEYAARGGNKAKGYKYSGANSIGNVSWYDGNSDNKTNAVAGKKANELGLYDMSGNALEWCMDKYAGDYYANSPKNSPKGATKGDARVIRGGGWNLNTTFSSVAFRYGSAFDGELYDYFGFRVVSIQQK